MRHHFVVLVVLAVAACRGPVAAADSKAPAPETPKQAEKEKEKEKVASCVDDGKPYDATKLRERLTALAAPGLDGRASGSAGERAARALIVERFRCLGLAAAGDGDGYEQAFTDFDGHATANVVGMLAGSSDEIVVVGAHHDHLGNKHLGANDNGSGVVGLLAIAQALRQRADVPKRSVVFVTFSAEEQGLIGSQYFVAHPPAHVPLAKVVQYINLDMLGSHAAKKAVYAFGAFPKLPARALLQTLATHYPKINLGIGGHSVRGDHFGFCKQGIPYVFLWTPDPKCYHETCDTADRIDYAGFAAITALAGGLVGGLADSATDLAAVRAKRGCGVP
jgi:hypothetical protein